MRYRKLSPTGDYVFGNGQADFLVNSPATVAQAILTRLKLIEGEWFLDVTEGTPYYTKVLGKNTRALYDMAIRKRILGTLGVKKIVAYTSQLNTVARQLTVQGTVDTIYGAVTFKQVL